MRFFKNNKEQEVRVINQITTESKEFGNNIFNKKNLTLFDVDAIQYVIDNFPSISVEIQDGLNNLTDILEHTIDHIEDKSSEIIKKNRDFKLSKAHRDTSIAIYEIVRNISEYVKWMEDELEKNIDMEYPKLAKINENPEEKSGCLINKIIDESEIEIFKDFSSKEPKSFKLDNNVVIVDDWNDLLVKTAEVLTKQYKKNKYSNKIVKTINPIPKKSTQNSFRDTVIEMLVEYKVSLDDFKIITK